MKEMWKELGNLLNTKKKSKGNSISKLIINVPTQVGTLTQVVTSVHLGRPT